MWGKRMYKKCIKKMYKITHKYYCKEFQGSTDSEITKRNSINHSPTKNQGNSALFSSILSCQEESFKIYFVQQNYFTSNHIY